MWALERTERSRHGWPVAILVAMTALTTWAILVGDSNNGPWPWEAYVIIAGTLSMGAVGLLTRTPVGVVLGGVAAVILVVGGLQWAVASEQLAPEYPMATGIYHAVTCLNLAISGAGIGILVSLVVAHRRSSADAARSTRTTRGTMTSGPNTVS